MLDFALKFIGTYDITTEVVALIMALLLLLLIAISKPDKSFMMHLVIAGTIMSMLTMVLHIAMLAQSIIVNETHSFIWFNIIYCLHSIVYVGILCIIYLYMSRLSLERRLDSRITIYNTIVLAITSHIFLAYPLVTGKLFVVEDGVYVLTRYFNFNVYTSVLCAFMTLCTVIWNRSSISRIVLIGSLVFVPFDGLGAVFQIYIPTAYFLCATYIIPFWIYYVLFHTYRFNEITGSQYYEAETPMIRKRLDSNQDFLMLTIHFPRLENLDYRDIKDQVLKTANSVCKKIEALHPGMRIYRITEYRYHVLCPINSDQDFENVASGLMQIFEDQRYISGGVEKTSRHILISRKFEQIKDADTYISFIRHMENEFTNPDKSEIKYVTDQDCEKYMKGSMIESNLLNIRTSQNLDDERVVVFIQPIYSIKDKQFRTGESLMRMKIDGQMIFPDEFIPVAENIECIHALTKVMLHKVAKKSIELAKQPNFDAVTVNVSTFELDNPEAGIELLGIIKDTGANPSNIRMEITESTTITDYSRIISNMNYLISNGIQFYLDDFGTGYSNLERISKFPFKTVKFDKSLLYRALEDKDSEDLFKLLLNHFKAKGFYTVIEGVENETQKRYVEENGFDYIQGYYFSKPLPEDQVDSFYC